MGYNTIIFNIKTLKVFFVDIIVCIFLKRLNDGIKIYDILYKELDYKNPSKNDTIIRQYFK